MRGCQRHHDQASQGCGHGSSLLSCLFSLPGTVERPQHCTSSQTPSEAPFPKPLSKCQQPDRLYLLFACNFLIIAKRKMAGLRGVGDSNKGLPDEGLSCCSQRSGFNKWLLFTNHFKALQLLSKRCFYT